MIYGIVFAVLAAAVMWWITHAGREPDDVPEARHGDAASPPDPPPSDPPASSG